MASVQFTSYFLTFLLTVAHFLDSCKEQEWNEPIFFNNYPFWLIVTTIFIGILQFGIIPAYIGNKAGNYYSIFASLYGLGAGGYHIPLHLLGKSNVCDNNFSYWIMVLLSISCIVLLISTIQKMIKKEEKVRYNKVETTI